MSSFVNLFSSLPFVPQNPGFSAPRTHSSVAHVKSAWSGRALILRVNCLTEPNGDMESEAKTTMSSSSSSSSSSLASIATYSWCAGLGGLGFAETSYLTYLKLTNSDAFCPIGGGTCGDVLNSDYASVFGVPLPLIGIFAYGLVTVLGLQLGGNKFPFKIDEDIGRLVLLGTTTSMAASSAYFLYILSTEFEGASCSYCLVSILLSFSLFFTILKIFGLQDIQKYVGFQLCLGGLVFSILSTSYSSSQPVAISSADVELRPFTVDITRESSSVSLALARHLRSIGAKMYGAFWCSHCLEQNEMFGREAAELIDYVECFPNGYKKGTKIEKACADAGIEGFPTWIINGEVLSGEQELSDLAKASGFELDNFVPPK